MSETRAILCRVENIGITSWICRRKCVREVEIEISVTSFESASFKLSHGFYNIIVIHNDYTYAIIFFLIYTTNISLLINTRILLFLPFHSSV